MKCKTLIFLPLLLACIGGQLSAQTAPQSKGSIQLDYGFANTLHYSAPVSHSTYYFPESYFKLDAQEARISKNAEISYYRNLNLKNEFRVGFGIFQYKFLERGTALQRGPTFIIWTDYISEHVIKSKFYTLSLGHRFKFNSEKNIKPYIENNLIYEHLRRANDVYRVGGLAASVKIGTLIKLTNNINLNLDGFFKSGIVKYNKKELYQDYVPYGYGLEFGINVKV